MRGFVSESAPISSEARCSSTASPACHRRKFPRAPARSRALRSAATGLHLSAASHSHSSWRMAKWPSWTSKLTVRAAAHSTATTGSALTGTAPIHRRMR